MWQNRGKQESIEEEKLFSGAGMAMILFYFFARRGRFAWSSTMTLVLPIFSERFLRALQIAEKSGRGTAAATASKLSYVFFMV